MQKWEYNTVVIDHGRDAVKLTHGSKNGILEFLDARGMDGWEIVAVEPCNDHASESRIYLKRPVEENKF